MIIRSRGSALALLLGGLTACSDPCAVVIGCTDSPRLAVEGRVLRVSDARGASGVSLRLLATYPDRVDSAATTSDDEGLFSVRLSTTGASAPAVSLRVVTPGKPGYVLSIPGCRPTEVRGDACVLQSVITEPNFRGFVFQYQDDRNPVKDAAVTFRRTSGALLYRSAGSSSPVAVDSLSVVTNDVGFGFLFPADVWASSLEAVVGDMTIDLPPPTGRVVYHGVAVLPNAFFPMQGLNVQLVSR